MLARGAAGPPGAGAARRSAIIFAGVLLLAALGAVAAAAPCSGLKKPPTSLVALAKSCPELSTWSTFFKDVKGSGSYVFGCKGKKKICGGDGVLARTLLMPTDAAWTTFLAARKLKLSQLTSKENKDLFVSLLEYHTLAKDALGLADIKATAASYPAMGPAGASLQLRRLANDSLLVTGANGTAFVLAGDIKIGKAKVMVINAVLTPLAPGSLPLPTPTPTPSPTTKPRPTPAPTPSPTSRPASQWLDISLQRLDEPQLGCYGAQICAPLLYLRTPLGVVMSQLGGRYGVGDETSAWGVSYADEYLQGFTWPNRAPVPGTYHVCVNSAIVQGKPIRGTLRIRGAAGKGADSTLNLTTVPAWDSAAAATCDETSPWFVTKFTWCEGAVCQPPCTASCSTGQFCNADTCTSLCGGRSFCSTDLGEACVGLSCLFPQIYALTISLDWDVPGDVDLVVTTPSGKVISYQNDGYAEKSNDVHKGILFERSKWLGPERVEWDSAADVPTGAFLVCASTKTPDEVIKYNVTTYKGVQGPTAGAGNPPAGAFTAVLRAVGNTTSFLSTQVKLPANVQSYSRGKLYCDASSPGYLGTFSVPWATAV